MTVAGKNDHPPIRARKGVFTLVLLLALLEYSSFGGEPARRLKVLTSVLPVFCFAANVAGDLADVENLLPDAVDPHEYQLSPGDLRKLEGADLILINGLGLEAWLEKALRASQGKTYRIVEVSTGLGPKLIGKSRDGTDHPNHSHGTDPSSANPHVWLDPTLAAHCVTNILTAFRRADPVHAEAFAIRSREYIAKLLALDSELARKFTGIKSVPFITYHDAFPYFVRRYGLMLAGVVEEVPEVSPSPQYLAQLSQTTRQKKARALFYHVATPSRLARQIAKDWGLKLERLDPMESGRPIPGAYEAQMRRNAESLARTLR